MPESLVTPLEKESPARRRRRKNGDFDLERITEEVLAGELKPDEHLWNKKNMQRLVGELIKVRLERIMSEVRQSYEDITDARSLIERMAFRKETLVTNAQISTLAQELQVLRQRSFCTEEAITKYIIRSFNKNRQKYGIVAKIDFGDIVIIPDIQMTQTEISESMNEL